VKGAVEIVNRSGEQRGLADGTVLAGDAPVSW
jgi:hypothetical protein